MTLARTLLACIACSGTLLGPLGACALAGTLEGCKEPKTGTEGIPIFSPPLTDVVIGVGRLHFIQRRTFVAQWTEFLSSQKMN
jgi:hypothetical protein